MCNGIAVKSVGIIDGDSGYDGEGDGSFQFHGLEP